MSAWIWSRRVDLGVFVGPTLLALALIGLARVTGFAVDGKLPEWGWLVFVLGIDVAHVWATIFRTYLDPIELRKKPWTYALVPIGCWLAGVVLHAHSSLTFWRALAYVAVFHFIRQQAGWAAIYRARVGQRARADRLIDNVTIYLSTGVPILIWHTRLPRPFAWFVTGDFVPLAMLVPIVPLAQIALGIAWIVFALRHLSHALAGRLVPAGKVAVVLTTAVSWYGGIVLAGDDLSFTLLNVLPHGVPYFALLWAYARQRSASAPQTPGSRIAALGFGAFLGLLLVLAFLEEMLWDRLIWADHPWLFGWLPAVEASPSASWRTWLVPLLALPQSTHYVLDAFLWRRRDTSAEQGRALGFAGSPR